MAEDRRRYPLEQEVYLSLLRAAHALQQAPAELFKAHGLTPTQYNVLRILRGAGPDGLMCSEISDRMIARDPDITRLIDRLQERGWVTRARPPEDRRAVHAVITEAGRDAIAPLDEPVQRLHVRQLSHLGRENLARLLDLLEQAHRPVQGSAR